MRIEKANPDILKGWYLGPWDWALSVSVGFAHQGVDEAHTFLSSSPDHSHFVIQAPGLQGEAARADKVPVLRSRLGL